MQYAEHAVLEEQIHIVNAVDALHMVGYLQIACNRFVGNQRNAVAVLAYAFKGDFYSLFIIEEAPHTHQGHILVICKVCISQLYKAVFVHAYLRSARNYTAAVKGKRIRSVKHIGALVACKHALLAVYVAVILIRPHALAVKSKFNVRCRRFFPCALKRVVCLVYRTADNDRSVSSINRARTHARYINRITANGIGYGTARKHTRAVLVKDAFLAVIAVIAAVNEAVKLFDRAKRRLFRIGNIVQKRKLTVRKRALAARIIGGRRVVFRLGFSEGGAVEQG